MFVCGEEVSMRRGRKRVIAQPLVPEVSPEQVDILPLAISWDLSAYKVQT